MTLTPAALKRMIGKDQLFLAEHDGAFYATNKYWVVPTASIWPLLAKFNIDANATGTYDVNGTITKAASDYAPSVGRFLNLADYDVATERVMAAGREAFAHDNANGFYALFRRENGGSHFGIRADWLEWLTEPPESYGERFSNVRLMGSEKPVAIVADRETKHGGHRDTSTDEYRWIPETWEPAGQVLLAVLMPIKIKG